MGEGNSLKNIEHIVDDIAAADVTGAEIEIVAVADIVVVAEVRIVVVAEAEADIVVGDVAEADIAVGDVAEADFEIVAAMVLVVWFVMATELGVQVEPMVQRNCYMLPDLGWQNGDDDIPVYLTMTQEPDVYFGLMQVE